MFHSTRAHRTDLPCNKSGMVKGLLEVRREGRGEGTFIHLLWLLSGRTENGIKNYPNILSLSDFENRLCRGSTTQWVKKSCIIIFASALVWYVHREHCLKDGPISRLSSRVIWQKDIRHRRWNWLDIYKRRCLFLFERGVKRNEFGPGPCQHTESANVAM